MKRKMVHRFTEVWRTDLGHKVRASIQDAPDISQEADFAPRRIIYMRKTPLATAGTVLYGQEGGYLLIDQAVLVDINRFRALMITDHLPWVRTGRTKDPVTGFDRGDAVQTLHAALPCVVEPIRMIQDRGLERVKMKICVGAAVQVGDRIGPYEVHVVIPFLGVSMLEVY